VYTQVFIFILFQVYIFLSFYFPYSYKLLFHQQRSFLYPCCCMTSNLCVPTRNSRDEGSVDLSHCPYTRVQVWGLDHESCTPM
jgi:hypothetical protein